MRSSIVKIAINENGEYGVSMKGALKNSEALAGLEMAQFYLIQKMASRNALIGKDNAIKKLQKSENN